MTEDWREEWDKAMAVWPKEIPFLAEGSIREASRFCGHPVELESALQAAAVRIRGDERLARFAWFLHRIYFHDPSLGELRIATSSEVQRYCRFFQIRSPTYAILRSGPVTPVAEKCQPA